MSAASANAVKSAVVTVESLSCQLSDVNYQLSAISCQISAVSCQLVSIPLVMQLSAVKGWLNWAGAIGLADTVKYTLYTVNC